MNDKKIFDVSKNIKHRQEVGNGRATDTMPLIDGPLFD